MSTLKKNFSFQMRRFLPVLALAMVGVVGILIYDFVQKEQTITPIELVENPSSKPIMVKKDSILSFGEFSCGRAVVEVYNSKKGYLYGYIDRKGNFIIEPQYDKAFSFSENRAFVKKGNVYLFIDVNNKKICEFTMPLSSSSSYMEHNVKYDEYFSAFKNRGLHEYFINQRHLADINKDYSMFVPEISDYIVNYGQQKTNKFVPMNGYYKYINNGRVITNKIFSFEPIKREHLIEDMVKRGVFYFKNGYSCFYDNASGRIGYIDSSGKFVIKPKYTYCYPFSNAKYAVVGYHAYYSTSLKRYIPLYTYLINSKGENISPLLDVPYDRFGIDADNRIDPSGFRNLISDLEESRFNVMNDGVVIYPYEFNSRYSILYWQLVDEKTNTHQEDKNVYYEGIAPFSEGLSLVYSDKKKSYSYINNRGEALIDSIDKGSNFSEGLAYVHLKKQVGVLDKKILHKGYINRKGEIVLDISSVRNKKSGKQIYDIQDAGAFEGGMASLKRDNKWGLINKKGEVIIDFLYDNKLSFKNGLARVGNLGFINIKGDTILILQTTELEGSIKIF